MSRRPAGCSCRSRARSCSRAFAASPVDLKALGQTVSAFSQFVAAHPEISEAELNPVLALSDKSVAVDAGSSSTDRDRRWRVAAEMSRGARGPPQLIDGPLGAGDGIAAGLGRKAVEGRIVGGMHRGQLALQMRRQLRYDAAVLGQPSLAAHPSRQNPDP